MHGRPGGRFQKWSLNSFGMRGPEVSAPKSQHIVRIVTVGASETFGLYESPGREYPRQLEDTLNARLASAASVCGERRAQVLNAAMPGMSLPTIDQDIRLRVRPLDPDFVIVYATPAAYLDDALPVAAKPDSGTNTASRLPARNAFYPRVADRIRTQIKSLLPAAVQDRMRRRQIDGMLAEHGPDWRFNTIPEERLARFEGDLRKVVGTIRASGATPVLLTHANRFFGSTNPDAGMMRAWEKFYPRASGATIVAFESAARLVTLKVARDSQAVLVDLAPALAGSSPAAFADYSHFTDHGAAVAATELAGPMLIAVNASAKPSVATKSTGVPSASSNACGRTIARETDAASPKS
jgi:hypothetical protein